MRIDKFLFVLFFLPVLGFGQGVDVTQMCSGGKINTRNNRDIFSQRMTENQQDYDVHFYGLDLTLMPDESRIDGSVVIGLQVIEDSIDHVELDLTSNYQVTGISYGESNLAFHHQDDILDILFDGFEESGTYLDLTIHYSGSPNNSSFNFDMRNGQPLIWSLSEPYGARTWWPCKDYPFDKADSAIMRFTVPEGLIVGSNGTLVSETTQNGYTSFTWRESYPITTYLISVAAHPYQLDRDKYVLENGDSMEVINYIFPDHFDEVVDDYNKTVDMLEFFSGIFGEYPFWKEKYGHAEFPWGGGMEHQTLTSILGPYEYLIAHELAHQWWGNMITCRDFHHIWLNEGFATYSEALWAEHTLGKEAYHDYMEGNAFYGAGSIYVPDLSNDGRIFSGPLSYNKASWVLHMLRNVVGEDHFFQILRAYGDSSRKFGVATTEQFKDICEGVSGMDLEAFFQQWIYEENHPEYAYEWNSVQENDAYIISLTIEQQQAWPLFTMPVDVKVFYETGDTLIRLHNELQIENYTLILDEEPVQLILDPDNWILKKVNEGRSQIQHNNGNMIISFADNGAIGFDQPNGSGNGLIFPSDGENLVYFGTSLIGSNAEDIIDNDIVSGENGFKRKPGTNIFFENESPHQEGQLIYSEKNDLASEGFEILQTTDSYSATEIENCVFINYEVINRTDQSGEALYIGILLDADIGYYLDNELVIDADRQMIYQENELLLGIKYLNEPDKLKLIGVRNAISRFTGANKFDYLSGNKNDHEPNEKNDWSMLLSYGPFDLPPNGSVQFPLAIIGAPNQEELLNSAREAQSFYDLNSSQQDLNISSYSFQLQPTLVDQKTRLEIKGQSGRFLHVELLDVFGRRINSWEFRIRQDAHQEVLDMENLHSGNYFLKLYGEGFLNTIKFCKI